MLYPNGTKTRPAVTSPFGPRKGGAFSFHYGADLVGFTTICAIAAGKVTFAGWMNPAAGYTIIIDHGGGVTSLYMHNAAHHVRRGDRVTEGQHIAVMGRSGNASGNCNHLEIRTHGISVEPLAYIAARLPRTGSATSTTPKPQPQEDDDMSPIIIAQRPNSALAKGRWIGGGKIQEITKHENTLLREAQEQNREAVIYVTVTDATYAALLKGQK